MVFIVPFPSHNVFFSWPVKYFNIFPIVFLILQRSILLQEHIDLENILYNIFSAESVLAY